jgi:uncharacterized protein (TIGR04255 family)
MTQKYKRPPITEAVVEVRMSSAVSQEVLEKVQKRLLVEYPAPPQRTFNMQVEVGEDTSKVIQEPLGYKLTSRDASDVVSISTQAIASSRLPPYEGWEPFIAQARRNWDIWTGIVGRREISRLGVRYINRLDIPVREVPELRIEDYLNFGLRLPKTGIPPMTHLSINSVAPLGKDECTLILNAGTGPSPLVQTFSLYLDLDISREVALPQRDDKLWEFVDRMREHKNFIFEACITDRARALFS